MDLATAIVVGIFGGLGVLLVVGALLTSRLIRLLRERHESIYESLGRPTLFLNNSISKNNSTHSLFQMKIFKDYSGYPE